MEKTKLTMGQKLKMFREIENLSQEELGQKLNVDIYLAAIVVFVGRMFNNLASIRRYYIDRFSNKNEKVEAEETVTTDTVDTSKKQ